MEYEEFSNPYAGDTLCGILPERGFCQCRAKRCSGNTLQRKFCRSVHSCQQTTQPLLQRGWRQTAGQCVRMHAVPYAPTSLCGSSRTRCRRLQWQCRAALCDTSAVDGNFAAAGQCVPGHSIIIVTSVSPAPAKQPLRQMPHSVSPVLGWVSTKSEKAQERRSEFQKKEFLKYHSTERKCDARRIAPGSYLKLEIFQLPT